MPLTTSRPRGQRCAIYTRKSTDRGLDMNVTSLQAQREVCKAYIKCQAHKNWIEVPQFYDDGGFSGGSLERPALQRLISDIEAGNVDVIVIYKIDRLTRSLLDFVRLIDVLERYEVSFVSVTQAFDTSDSMGRLILNILLTFAQFERELMSDRVRDKKAAMQRKGYFTGGLPPFGYLIDSGGRLCIDDERAPIVRELFARYPTCPVRSLINDLRDRGCVTRRYTSKAGRIRGGQPITTAVVSHILGNPIYTGHIVHRGEWIEAQVDPLVTRETWDAVQHERMRRTPKRDPITDFLSGILFDEHGRHMRVLRSGPGRTNPYRYYRAEASGWSRKTEHKRTMVDADQTESLVRACLSAFLRDRKQVKAAVLADERYSDAIAKLLRKGAVAARRLECMAASEFRRALVALVPRVEVTKTHMRLLVSCFELKRFLDCDSSSTFMESAGIQSDRIYMVESPASLLRGHHHYTLPIFPCERQNELNADLVKLLGEAAELREAVYSCRHTGFLDLAKRRGMTQNRAVCLMRLNYLAPDIITAVLDGTLPEGTTQRSLFSAAMCLDWARQREALGVDTSRTRS